MQNFRALGALPPDPCASGGWGLLSQTPSLWQLGSLPPAPIGLRRLGAPPSDPKISPSPLRIFGYAHGSIFGEDLFFGLHLNSREKTLPFLVKTFFFALHLICSPEKNGGRGSSPPMLKLGQNWGKIANYLPQCSTKICTPGTRCNTPRHVTSWWDPSSCSCARQHCFFRKNIAAVASCWQHCVPFDWPEI